MKEQEMLVLKGHLSTFSSHALDLLFCELQAIVS